MPPAEATRRKQPPGDRHKARVMVSLPPWLYAKLKASAARNSRRAAQQMRHILIQALLTEGTLTPDEIDRHAGD